MSVLIFFGIIALLFLFLANCIVLFFGTRRILSGTSYGENGGSKEWGIVFGGPVGRGMRLSAVLEDRLLSVLSYFQAGRVARILCTGSGSSENNEVEVMRRWLEDHGVPADSIDVDGAGFRTIDSIFRARRLFLIGDAYFFSQRFHLARILFLAQILGIDGTGVSADRQPYRDFTRFRLRELFARVRVFCDLLILNRRSSKV